MQTRIKIFLPFLFLVSAVSAQIKISSFKEALSLCLRNNKTLQTAALREKQETQNKYAAFSALGPQVKLFSAFDNNFSLPTQLIPAQIFGGPAGTFTAVRFGTTFNATAGADANMPLINSSAWMDLKLSGMNKELSQKNYSVQELEISKQLVRGYYATLLSKEYESISKENYSVADSLFYFANEKNKNGLIDPIDFNRIKNNFLISSSGWEESKSTFLKNLNNLKLLIGLKQEDSLVIGEKIKDETNTNAAPAILSTDKEPSLLFAALNVQIAKTSLLKENLKRLPEVSLYARYYKQGMRNDPDIFNANQTWFKVGLVGVRIDMPIFTGYARQAQINKTKIRLKIAQLELENETEKLKAENMELFVSLQQSTTSLANSKESMELSKENNRIALNKYIQGLYSLDQYLNVFNESLNIQRQYLKNFGDYFISKTILEMKSK